LATNEYYFSSQWQVEGTADEVAAILSDVEALPRWWPSVYREVYTLRSGNQQGIGKVVELHTKGWLPYTLLWQFTVVARDLPHSLTLDTTGDFVGRAVWTFAQDGPLVNVGCEWQFRAEKRLLRYLSPLLKPLFRLNHLWAMDRGLASLKLELRRQQARSVEELAHVPAPPPPPSALTLPLALAAMLGLVGLLGLRRRR